MLTSLMDKHAVMSCRTKDGRDKARMLVPAWLVGTVMGKNAQNIISANAETGALMRFAPAGES